MPRWAWAILWLGSLALVAGITLFACTRPTNRVLKTWEGPEYEGVRYYLSVLNTDVDWRGLPFDARPRRAIYVGREKEHPTYGHLVDFSFIDDPAVSEVRWDADGVELIAPSGHRLYIPKRWFMGGR